MEISRNLYSEELSVGQTLPKCPASMSSPSPTLVLCSCSTACADAHVCEIVADFNSLHPKCTFQEFSSVSLCQSLCFICHSTLSSFAQEMKRPPQPLPCFPGSSTPYTPRADQSNLPQSAQHQRHRIARIPGEPEDGIAAQQPQKGCFCEHEEQIPTKTRRNINSFIYSIYIYIYDILRKHVIFAIVYRVTIV